MAKKELLHKAQSRIEELESVLYRIANPVWALQKDAEAEGSELDGMMAIQIANDASTLKDWASSALS